MAQIFISYSRKDIEFVRRLAGDLEKAGYNVWWDLTDLRGGDDWPRVIPAAIESSQFVIVVLSPNSVVSDWVEKEYTQALDLRKKIIPVLLKPTRLPFALNTINYVNFASGEYVDNLNKLLAALEYAGAPVARPVVTLPLLLRKYAIPIGIGVLFLLALLSTFFPTPPAPPTPPTETPVILSSMTLPPTFTPEPATPTVSPTSSSTSTPTATSTEPANTETSTPSPTVTPTLPIGFSLPICIYADSRVYVREGPGFDFIPMGVLEGNGTKCPFFSGYIRNRDQEVWFQLAPTQLNAEFEQFAGRWIYESSLAAVDRRVLPLPICIYDPGAVVEIRLLPSRNAVLLENTLRADGTHCPFFDTRIQNDEGTWYHFATNQKEKKDDFGQYAGAWIHEDALVVNTQNLPTVTLTPTLAPSDTPTSTPTLTRTPSPTATDTLTPTDTPTPTATPTEAPTP